MKKITLFLLCSFLLFSCTPAAQTPSSIVTVYAFSAAEPWLSELFACASDLSIVLKIDAESPDIYLRLGEPELIISPVYQIDEEEILIVTHRESTVQNLTLLEAQALFAEGDSPTQVWVYASGADLQLVFDQLAMKERGVSSSARIAVSVQNMSDVINSESNSVGILPKHWVAGNIRAVYSVGTVPVLAVTKEEAAGEVKNLLACLSN